MNCRCGGQLTKTHTYVVPNKGRTISSLCAKCKRRTTLVEFVVNHDPHIDTGAKAIAARMAAGELVPKLEEPTDV